MNNKKLKLTLVLLLLFILTGCTKYMQYEDKKAVKNTETGQRIVENILCKTDATETTYEKIKKEQTDKLNEELKNENITQEEYDEKIKNLNDKFTAEGKVDCSEFKITSGGYEGLFTTIFVKPLAFLIVKVGTITQNYGWAIIIITILIRLALYPVTKKTALQSEGMKKAQPKIEKLEEKYRNRSDQQSQMAKSQEMMKIYKEYKISPMSGCLFALIQIPLFLSFYEALYRLPVVLEEKFFGIQLGLTPWTAISHGKYYYLIFVVLVVAATYFSFKLNSAVSGAQAKQMKMMSNMSVIMISIASFSVSTGIALYWIFNSGFTIVQNLLVKRGKKNDNII